MGIQLSDLVENIVRKQEIACYRQFLLFPRCFHMLSVVEYLWSKRLNIRQSNSQYFHWSLVTNFIAVQLGNDFWRILLLIKLWKKKQMLTISIFLLFSPLCFLPNQRRIAPFEPQWNCHLLMLSTYTRLKFCYLVMGQLLLYPDVFTA